MSKYLGKNGRTSFIVSLWSNPGYWTSMRMVRHSRFEFKPEMRGSGRGFIGSSNSWFMAHGPIRIQILTVLRANSRPFLNGTKCTIFKSKCGTREDFEGIKRCSFDYQALLGYTERVEMLSYSGVDTRTNFFLVHNNLFMSLHQGR